MGVIRAQITIPSSTGIPEDAVTNTLHFGSNALDKNYPNLDDIIFDFYDVAASGAGSSIASFMSGSYVSNTWTIKYYDLGDLKPRIPIHEETREVTLGTGDILPTEVACCLSFQATRESGKPQARRRNRIYLGPFRATASVAGRPSTSLRTAIAKNARTMLASAQNAASWEWVVYSPTIGGEVNEKVDNGWVDNAWDTQRRRGYAATTRDEWNDTDPA